MSDVSALPEDSHAKKLRQIEMALLGLKVLPDQVQEVPRHAQVITWMGRRPRKVNLARFTPKGARAVSEQLDRLARDVKRVENTVSSLSQGAVDAMAQHGLMTFDLIKAVVDSQRTVHVVVELLRTSRSALPALENPVGGNAPLRQAQMLARYVAAVYEQLTGKSAPLTRDNSGGSRNLEKDLTLKKAPYELLMKEVFAVLEPGGSTAYRHHALEAAKWRRERRKNVSQRVSAG